MMIATILVKFNLPNELNLDPLMFQFDSRFFQSNINLKRKNIQALVPVDLDQRTFPETVSPS